MSGNMQTSFYPSSHQLDQYSAAFKVYGDTGLTIGLNAQMKACSQIEGGYSGGWSFIHEGELGYWAPESEGPFTVNCPGSFTTIEAVDARSLGIAFTVMAINHMAFDAFHQDNEKLCEKLAEWQEQLRNYAFDAPHLDGSAVNTILD